MCLTLFCIVHLGQQAKSKAGAQRPMHGGRSYFPLDDILLHAAEHMIDDNEEESDDHGENVRPNPRTFTMTITGFEKYKMKLPQRIIRLQQYLDVIRKCALSLITDYQRSIVAHEDVAWLCKHDHIVNHYTRGSLANTKLTSSWTAAN
jgi:hypothetical protein